MQREIWAEMHTDLEVDLRRLGEVSAADLARHLHRVRGYASSASLLRLSEILLAWEKAPNPAEATKALLPEALETSRRSIAEVEKKYPHLVVRPQAPG